MSRVRKISNEKVSCIGGREFVGVLDLDSVSKLKDDRARRKR